MTPRAWMVGGAAGVVASFLGIGLIQTLAIISGTYVLAYILVGLASLGSDDDDQGDGGAGGSYEGRA